MHYTALNSDFMLILVWVRVICPSGRMGLLVLATIITNYRGEISIKYTPKVTDRSKIEDGKWVSVAIMIAAWTHIIVLKFYQSNKLQFNLRISTCPYSFKARPQECVFSLLISIPVHDRLRISERFSHEHDHWWEPHSVTSCSTKISYTCL